MIADFTLGVGNESTKIIITDSSTVNYGGESILSRNVLIQDSTGVITTVPFPIVDGVGDVLNYDLITVRAVKITLVLTPSVVDEDSVYEKHTTYSMMVYFDAYFKSLEYKVIYETDPRCVLASSTRLLREFEWATALRDSAESFATQDDVNAIQECIDSLKEMSKQR
jgi:hypothetical protein